MRKYVYPTIEHVQKVTEFKDADTAEAAIETLIWLDQGAPSKFDGLKRKFEFNMNFFLEQAADHNMAKYYPDDCGTTCCIAGAIISYKTLKKNKRLNYVEHIANHFNLSNNKLHKLFYADDVYNAYLEYITPFEAAQTLRRYLKTGVVDWSHLEIEVLRKREAKDRTWQ